MLTEIAMYMATVLWSVTQGRKLMFGERRAKPAEADGMEVRLVAYCASNSVVRGISDSVQSRWVDDVSGSGLGERQKADIVRMALREASVQQLLAELAARGIRPNVEITVNYSNHTFNRCNVRMLVSDGQLVGEVDDVPMDRRRIGRR